MLPQLGNDRRIKGTIRIVAVVEHIATDSLIFLGNSGLIPIIELILGQKIVFLQHILIDQRVIAGIESGLGYGRISDAIYDNKTTIATGPSDPADTATTTGGRCPHRQQRLQFLVGSTPCRMDCCNAAISGDTSGRALLMIGNR